MVLDILSEIYPTSVMELKCFDEEVVTNFYIKNNFKIKSIKFENPKYWLMEKDNVIH